VALPSKEVVPTERKDTEIHYPHRHALLLIAGGLRARAGQAGRRQRLGDRHLDGERADEMRHGRARQSLRVRPVSRGDLRVRLPAPASASMAAPTRACWHCASRARPTRCSAPTGVRWEQVSPTEWMARLPAGQGLPLRGRLPDDKAETLALFTRHAYAFITDTRVDWRYDVAASQVETTFKATTRVMEGPDNGPLLGLYPHHWFNNASRSTASWARPTTPCAARSACWPRRSSRRQHLHGFVPYWPGVPESPRKSNWPMC
jgi:hypothetical protein